MAADLDNPDAIDAALDALDDRARALARSHGKRAARRLINLCEASLARVKSDETMIPARPTADIVTTADAPCDATRTPGWLLTTLTGRHLRATSTLIQRLIDTRGADLRGIVVDDHGQAIDGTTRWTHTRTGFHLTRPPTWAGLPDP